MLRPRGRSLEPCHFTDLPSLLHLLLWTKTFLRPLHTSTAVGLRSRAVLTLLPMEACSVFMSLPSRLVGGLVTHSESTPLTGGCWAGGEVGPRDKRSLERLVQRPLAPAPAGSPGGFTGSTGHGGHS